MGNGQPRSFLRTLGPWARQWAKLGRSGKIAIAVALAAAIAGLVYLLGGRSTSEINYRLAAVETGPIVSTASATGSLKAALTVPVAAQVPGRVIEVDADYNDQVHAGDILARLDPEAMQASVAAARADLDIAHATVETAQGQLDRAKRGVENARDGQDGADADLKNAELQQADASRDLKRTRQLMATGDAARIDTEHATTTSQATDASLAAAKARQAAAGAALASAEADVTAADGQLKNALATVTAREDALHQAEVNLDHTQIRSPIDGTVLDREIDLGQSVPAGPQPVPAFVIVSDLRHMRLHVNVDEADIGRVKRGQPVTFTVDAFPGQMFSGSVEEIREAPLTLQTLVAYDVVVAVANDDLRLLPGMTADVRIVTDRRDTAIKVPNAALRFEPEKAGAEAKAAARGLSKATSRVWILGPNDRPRAKEIHTGISDGIYTEVLDGGLAAGDQVIVGSLASPGDKAAAGPLKF